MKGPGRQAVDVDAGEEREVVAIEQEVWALDVADCAVVAVLRPSEAPLGRVGLMHKRLAKDHVLMGRETLQATHEAFEPVYRNGSDQERRAWSAVGFDERAARALPPVS